MEERKALLLEGLLPADVWNALIVVLILFGVFMAVFKGVVAIRDEVDKRKKKKSLNQKDITDEIADKVMEKMETTIDEKFAEFNKGLDKKLDDIDKKLRADKETIELHTTQLNDHESRVSKLEGGNLALCHGMLALLERDPALVKEQRAMKNYLIDGKYRDTDWQ